MSFNVKDLVRLEWIGRKVEIAESENKALVGLKGKIVDETKNMFMLDVNGKMKKIIKDQVKLKINFDSHTYKIDGKLLVGRPEDRIKKIRSI